MTPTQLKKEYERLRALQNSSKDFNERIRTKEKANELYSKLRYILNYD